MIGQIVNKDSLLANEFIDNIKNKLLSFNLDPVNAENLIKLQKRSEISLRFLNFHLQYCLKRCIIGIINKTR